MKRGSNFPTSRRRRSKRPAPMRIWCGTSLAARCFPEWLFRSEIVAGPLLKPSLYGSRALERIEARLRHGDGGYGLLFQLAQRAVGKRAGYLSFA